MKIIVLDSSVIIGDNFAVTSAKYEELKKLSLDGSIKILMPELVVSEIKSNILKHAAKAKKALQVFQSEGRLLKNFPEHRQNLFPNIEHIDIVNKLNQMIDQFLTDSNVEILQTSDVCEPAILKRYFNGEPPFERGGADVESSKDKRFEFPDAIALAGVELWSKKNNSKVVLVSRDKGWAQFGSKNNIETSDGVQKVIDSFLQYKMKMTKLEEALKKKTSSLGLSIAHEIENRGFFANDKDAEVLETSQFGVDGVEPSIISYNEANGEGSIWVNAMITFHAEVKFGDQASASYDHEDKRLLFHRYITQDWFQVLAVDAEFDFYYDAATDDLQIDSHVFVSPEGDIEVVEDVENVTLN